MSASMISKQFPIQFDTRSIVDKTKHITFKGYAQRQVLHPIHWVWLRCARANNSALISFFFAALACYALKKRKTDIDRNLCGQFSFFIHNNFILFVITKRNKHTNWIAYSKWKKKKKHQQNQMIKVLRRCYVIDDDGSTSDKPNWIVLNNSSIFSPIAQPYFRSTNTSKIRLSVEIAFLEKVTKDWISKKFCWQFTNQLWMFIKLSTAITSTMLHDKIADLLFKPKLCVRI